MELALARNRMRGRTGYFSRWVYARVEPSPCVFTRELEPGTVLPLPVAHAEGRFVGSPGRVPALVRAGQTPLRYARHDGALATAFPEHPNGAEESVAAVCNPRGNVLAILPHPERAQDLGAVPRQMVGPWPEARSRAFDDGAGGAEAVDDAGPGLRLFEGLRRHLVEV